MGDFYCHEKGGNPIGTSTPRPPSRNQMELFASEEAIRRGKQFSREVAQGKNGSFKPVESTQGGTRLQSLASNKDKVASSAEHAQDNSVMWRVASGRP